MLRAVDNLAGERVLIEAAQQDPRRFADLYDLHFARVYAFIARRVRNREEAEDLTSQVFQQALANIQRYEWRGTPFANWLYRMAANAIVDRWQSASSEPMDPRREAIDPASLNEIERRAMLFQLVDRLPPDQRSVILHRFVEQKSILEVARELGRSEGAVKQLQLRAIGNLRKQMGDFHG